MNKNSNSPRRLISTLALVSVLGLAACGSDDDSSDPVDAAETSTATDVSISDPWSRQPAEGQTASAVYGVVTNNTDDAITAIAASTPVTETVEIHETSMNDEGQMSMSEKDGGFEIPAGESFTFEPGGPHIMLLGIDPAVYPDTVDVTLEFDNGTTLDFSAEVREISGDAMNMDDDMDMDHGGTETTE